MSMKPVNFAQKALAFREQQKKAMVDQMRKTEEDRKRREEYLVKMAKEREQKKGD